MYRFDRYLKIPKKMWALSIKKLHLSNNKIKIIDNLVVCKELVVLDIENNLIEVILYKF
jgi:Leucine-rich repeat (LRR) protein